MQAGTTPTDGCSLNSKGIVTLSINAFSNALMIINYRKKVKSLSLSND